MKLEQAQSLLTAEQVKLATVHGTEWGKLEADMWFDQHEDAAELPLWTMGNWCGNANEICGTELNDEQKDAFDLVVDCAARDAWGSYVRPVAAESSLTEEECDELRARIEAADLVSPDAVSEHVLDKKTFAEAEAELAKAIANNPAEEKAAGIRHATKRHISLYVDGVFAGSGVVNHDSDGDFVSFTDCGAQFCDDTDESESIYEKIDEALEEGDESLKVELSTRKTIAITWTIGDEV